MFNTASIIQRYVKSRKGKDPWETIDRNVRLYREYYRSKNRPFVVPLVAKYRISSKRIYQIINRVKRWGGVKKKTLTGAQLVERRKRAIERYRSLIRSRKSKLPSDLKKMAKRGAYRGEAEVSLKDGGTHATKSRPSR